MEKTYTLKLLIKNSIWCEIQTGVPSGVCLILIWVSIPKKGSAEPALFKRGCQYGELLGSFASIYSTNIELKGKFNS